MPDTTTHTRIVHGRFALGGIGCSVSTSRRRGDAGFLELAFIADGLTMRLVASAAELRAALPVLHEAEAAATAARAQQQEGGAA